ncbi:MAG: hypothetical protein ACOYO1_00575 [Bacteroidales bacterium]
MKKIIIILTITLSLFNGLKAQQLISKKGIPILPQKGDFAIGISATPFFDFVGNITKINATSAFKSSASFDFLNPDMMYIYGKYFLKDNTAIRGKIRIGLNKQTKNAFVDKYGSTTGETIEDKWTHSSTNIILAAGIEKRRGYGRLQGFYGAETMISLMGGQYDTYVYGNDITSANTNPKRTNFNSNVSNFGYLLENKTSTVFGFGVNAFVGVEYFFAPKMSIGGEFGWGIGFNQGPNTVGTREYNYEFWNGGSVENKTVDDGGKVSTFTIDTKTTGGQIFLLFHF